MTNPTYFVAATECFKTVTDPSLWVKSNATSLDGAKRLATKQARSTTFTVRVAIKNAKGQFETIATLDNSFAITRHRPMWRAHITSGLAAKEKELELKNEIRIDYHFADNATPAFIGVFVTTKEAYQAGESPDADDVVQFTVNPRDRVVCDLLEDAAERACNAANKASPSSPAQALSVAVKSLEDSGKINNPAVAKFAEALWVASRKIAQTENTNMKNELVDVKVASGVPPPRSAPRRP